MPSRLLAGSRIILLIAMAALAGLVRGDPGKPTADETQRLIDQLGDAQFARRKAAGRELEAAGAHALPALRKAAASAEDEEVRRSAGHVLDAILRPHSPSNGLELALIEAGTFRMGSPVAEGGHRDDEKSHEVKISRAFYLGIYEVTQGEYRKLMKSDPSWFAPAGGGAAKVGKTDTDRYPVEQVTWFDAVEFCNRLSAADGYPPFYKLADVKRKGDSIIAAEVTVLGGRGYRLPTEAEWEYACRAGSTTPFHFGRENSGREANVKPPMVAGGYGGDFPKWPDLGRTNKVGSYKPNAWGLHDMHGNVGEWCHDWYDKGYYADSPAADPTGPKAGTQRAIRGGAWLLPEQHARSAARFGQAPDDAKFSVGFRVARTP